MNEYYIIEWDLPVIEGECTNGSGDNITDGFGTPATCTNQPDGETTTRTYSFTDTNLILDSDIYKCVADVQETTVELKGGTGLASRATVNIMFKDFINVDPNADSPAVVADSSIIKNSTFFTKLNQRNYLTNKPLRVIRVGYDEYTKTEVYRETNSYLSQTFKRSSNGSWTLQAKDAMYRADTTKTQYPNTLTGRLTTAIDSDDTTVIFEGDVADWSDTDYVAVIGEDILTIDSVTGSSTSVTLTCTRSSSITLGTTNPRTITNTPAEHSVGDEVFRGRLFEDAQIADVLVDIFDEIGIDSANWDYDEINDEIQTWVASAAVSTIYYESKDSAEVLNNICATYLMDIWFDTLVTDSFPSGQIKVKSTSPWVDGVADITEGVDYDYNSLTENAPESKQFSRCFLQYNKENLTANDDDVHYKTSSLAIDSEVEQDRFSGEVTLKRLGKSNILGGSNSDIQVGDLTVTRFAQRFSQKPTVYQFKGNYDRLGSLRLGDVVNLLSDSIINNDGTAKEQNRTQIINIKPERDRVAGINYSIKALTYNPFTGAVAGDPIPVTETSDIILYTQAGGPTAEDEEYTFLFDGNQFFQSEYGQTITTGDWPDGSTLNLVFLSGADARAAGGAGGTGEGSDGDAIAGGNGGTVLLCESSNASCVVNIYLGGTHTVQGEDYDCDGMLIAPGGGGGGSGVLTIGTNFTGDGGSGGAGRPFGIGGDPGGVIDGYVPGTSGSDGSQDDGGASSNSGGSGGGSGESGDGGDSRSGTGAAGGSAGKAISFTTGTTVNVYGNTATNYIQGSGDTPNLNP